MHVAQALLEENLTMAPLELRDAAMRAAQALLEGNLTRPPPELSTLSPPPHRPSLPRRGPPRGPWSHRSRRAPPSPMLRYHPLLRGTASIAAALPTTLAILLLGDGAGLRRQPKQRRTSNPARSHLSAPSNFRTDGGRSPSPVELHSTEHKGRGAASPSPSGSRGSGGAVVGSSW